MRTPLHELTATEIVGAIRRGETTCEAVTRACLDRIAEREPHVEAWQYLDPDQAISAARARDRERRDGPLLGVPFNVKDIIDTSDMPTEYGSPIYADHVPTEDHAIVERLRAAGAILLGKTNTPEFAVGAQTFNPIFGATRASRACRR